MKFISIKNIKISLLMILTIFVTFSCVDEEKSPIVTFDSAGKGAYVRVTEQTGDLLLNLLTQADFNASQFGYSVRFIDVNQGADVVEYVLDVQYVDVTGANSSGPSELRTYGSSTFTKDSEGFMAVENISVTSADVTSVFGLTYSDLTAGDEFRVIGKIVMSDGSEHTFSNSSASVNGTAFQGFFNFTMPAACPSDLTGSFAFSTVVGAGHPGCSGGETVSGTVDIVAQGGGVYKFSDWAFGAYGPCYGGGTAGGDLTFTEVCTVVAFTGFTDSFGDTWTFVSSISGDEWTIDWVNTYAEEAVSVITFPGGVPFTLK